MTQIKESMKMEINEVREITIEEFFFMCESQKGEYQIETPDGWQNINFLVKKKNRECYNLITETGLELGCSSEHEVLTNSGWKKSKNIDVNNDTIFTVNGKEDLVSKEYVGIRDTFDLQVDHENSRYYSNDIVSHNCGKSLVCKSISTLWNMPLLRMDFGSMFGSLVGESEARIRTALKLAEAVSPTVLWLDEIEKALAGVNSGGRTDSGTTMRVLSTFLTWMQEKEASVFVVATANDHSIIPPEFLRYGRFDEIFFVDLPSESERKEIFKIHLKKKKYKIKDFDINYLAKKSDHYSGAEIEKAINMAMLVGFQEDKRKIETKDVAKQFSKFKSLFAMRSEDFTEIREWAEDRCVRANTEEIKEVDLGLKGAKELDI